MELFLYLIIIIAVYILFGILSYKIWSVVFDTKFGILNKRMKIASIILGILWPIGLIILIIITIIDMITNKNKK